MIFRTKDSYILALCLLSLTCLISYVTSQRRSLGLYSRHSVPWNNLNYIRQYSGYGNGLENFPESPLPWYVYGRGNRVSMATGRSGSRRSRRRPSVAERVLSDLDMSVSPCEDFYQFSCGGYLRRIEAPNGIAQNFLSPKARLDHVLIGALEERIQPMDIEPLKQAKIMYRTCMDEETLERRGRRDLHAYIRDLGGWPVLGHPVPADHVLVDNMAKVRRIQFDVNYPSPRGVLIGLSIISDLHGSGKFAIYLDEPALGQRGVFGSSPSKRQYKLARDDVFITAYTRYIYELAVTLGAPPSRAWREAETIVDLETDIVQVGLEENERRDLTSLYRKCKIRDVMQRYPQFDWLRFIRQTTAIPGSNFVVTMDTDIFIVKRFFDDLFEVLSRYSKRTIANYVVFRGIHALLSAASKPFQDITARYEEALSGIPRFEPPPRNVTCSDHVSQSFAWVTGRLYVQRGFSPEKLRQYRDLTSYVRGAFTNIIATSDWLSDHSKNRMLDKMASIKDKIGFPDYILDDNFLYSFYRNHRVNPYSLLDSFRMAREQNFVQNLMNLIDPRPDRWVFGPAFVNAFSPVGPVAIEMYAAILGEPFFSLDYPASMKFGGIGSLIGHEYGHQFDLRGINVNRRGEIESLLSPGPSQRYYNTRTSCVVRQYSNYYIPAARTRVNTIETLTENMADIVGVKSGYKAFKDWQSRTGSLSRVQGLPFTGDQLYFINAARIWCAKYSPQYERRWNLSDSHSLERYRVYGPMQNSKEFADAFSCPVNSPMNPVNKCSFL